MKQFVRLALVLFGVTVAILVVVGSRLRASWSVERSIVIDANRQTVYGYLADLGLWRGWSLWNDDLDPTAKFEFEEHAPGAGQRMHWHGKHVGDGTLTLLSADPKDGVRYEEQLAHFASSGRIVLTDEGAKTKVTWTDAGDVGWNLPARFAIRTLEGELGPAMDKSLRKLQELSEHTRKPPGAVQPDPPAPPLPTGLLGD